MHKPIGCRSGLAGGDRTCCQARSSETMCGEVATHYGASLCHHLVFLASLAGSPVGPAGCRPLAALPSLAFLAPLMYARM